MDLFQEEEKKGETPEPESRNMEINIEADTERRKQQFIETKDLTYSNPEEENKDDEEILMSMKPGAPQSALPEMAATL